MCAPQNMHRLYISDLYRMASYSLLEEVWALPQHHPVIREPPYPVTRESPFPVAREPSHLVPENSDLLAKDLASTDVPELSRSNDGMTDCQTRIQQLEMEINSLRQALSPGIPRAERTGFGLDMTRNDLMFYVASGVFTIFLLDSFLNAGLKHRP